MKLQDLLDEWEDGSTGLRPARVQKLREDIEEHTGMVVPRRIPEIENWMQTMKGQVTRKLRAAASGEEDG